MTSYLNSNQQAAVEPITTQWDYSLYSPFTSLKYELNSFLGTIPRKDRIKSILNRTRKRGANVSSIPITSNEGILSDITAITKLTTEPTPTIIESTTKPAMIFSVSLSFPLN